MEKFELLYIPDKKKKNRIVKTYREVVETDRVKRP
jgi:hypothetical protein